jgi:hypothetical protein
MEEAEQKKRIIRDVIKNINISIYDEGAVLYNKGDVA